MIIDKSIYKTRKPKELNFDATLAIRVNMKEFNYFKEYYGNNWTNQLRQYLRTAPYKDKINNQNEKKAREYYARK